MKKLSTVVLASVLILLLPSPLTRFAPPAFVVEDCSCDAPDGSCSVTISCQGGCTKFCGSNGNCHAKCSGDYAFLEMEVTLDIKNGTYPQLVTKLARLSGKSLEFSPTKPDMVFNAGFKRVPLWDALELLSDRGTVQVAGLDFEKLKRLRRLLLSGERISFCVKNTPADTFVSDMAGVTGLPLRIIAGRPMAIVNVQLEDVTLNDILAEVAEQTGTKIVEQGADAGPSLLKRSDFNL